MVNARFTRESVIFLVFSCFCISVGFTQELSPFDRLETILKVIGADQEQQNQELKEFAIELVQNDPELASRIFDLPLVSESFLGRLFEDTNLKLKVFDADGEEGVSLGFSYSYVKNHKVRFSNQSVNYSGLDISFKANGNVAFDADANPNDFLDTKVSLSYFMSQGGVSGEIKDSETLNKLNQLSFALAKFSDIKTLRQSTEWRQYKDIIGRHLTDQYYLDIGIDGGLESDQSFDDKQYTFGGKAGLVARGWGEDSILGKINVLDYVPALIRRYSGVDDQWRPRGSAFPNVLLGVDWIMPEEGDPRERVGADSDYTRFKVEASFKTQVTRWESEPVYLEANFRYYKELDPSSQVEAADLDEFTYLVTALRLPMNLFVSYTTGRLPLDASDDQVYAIGFDYNF